MNFNSLGQPMNGLYHLERQAFADQRGAFSRLFCKEELRALGWDAPVAQSNFSQTVHKGTIRGLHYQHPPHAEKKLVTCVAGAVFDVAVDLRKGSSTFGQWYSCELSARNNQSLLIPEGFAHGFQTLSDDVTMIYFHSTAYTPQSEAGIRWDDPDMAINWPMAPTSVSDRDQALGALAELDEGISL